MKNPLQNDLENTIMMLVLKLPVINVTKEKAIWTLETTHCIATQAYVGVSQAVAGQLPNPQYLKRNIRNIRNILKKEQSRNEAIME